MSEGAKAVRDGAECEALEEVADLVEVAPTERTPVVRLEPRRLGDGSRLKFVHGDAAFALRAVELGHV